MQLYHPLQIYERGNVAPRQLVNTSLSHRISLSLYQPPSHRDCQWIPRSLTGHLSLRINHPRTGTASEHLAHSQDLSLSISTTWTASEHLDHSQNFSLSVSTTGTASEHLANSQNLSLSVSTTLAPGLPVNTLLSYRTSLSPYQPPSHQDCQWTPRSLTGPLSPYQQPGLPVKTSLSHRTSLSPYQPPGLLVNTLLSHRTSLSPYQPLGLPVNTSLSHRISLSLCINHPRTRTASEHLTHSKDLSLSLYQPPLPQVAKLQVAMRYPNGTPPIYQYIPEWIVTPQLI